MQKMTEDEIKQNSVMILKDIKRVCKELNLTYFLDSGSLLGAVRHNGFIPWDDDIDVSMPRPDYEVFIRKYNQYSLQQYRLKSIENTLSYPYPFAKVYDKTTIIYEHGRSYCNLGLSVDVFPIDAYPNSEEERIGHWEKSVSTFVDYSSEEGAFFSNYSFNPRKIKHNIHIFFVRHGLFRNKAKKVIKNSKTINWDDAKFAGINVSMYYRNKPRYVDKDCFIPIEHVFEDDLFSIPQGYDIILKTYYGEDYMTPPPENKRTSTHGIDVYHR